MPQTIPVSVIITTYNEEHNMARCLTALKDFDEVIVVDSNSDDQTKEISLQHGARVENYTWNGAYPKKRQWILDHLKTQNDFIFFVDGDEVLTPDIINEISCLDFNAAGYFVKGQYVWFGKILKHGLINNKLCLFNKNKIEFPVVDDLNINGMGEIEGHYQPVLKVQYQDEAIDQVNAPLLHYAYEGADNWRARHERYAQWEAKMIKDNAYPVDPVAMREFLKKTFRKLPFRGAIAFCHSYFYKGGFLDGRAGYDFAKSRMHYYQLVNKALKTPI